MTWAGEKVSGKRVPSLRDLLLFKQGVYNVTILVEKHKVGGSSLYHKVRIPCCIIKEKTRLGWLVQRKTGTTVAFTA